MTEEPTRLRGPIAWVDGRVIPASDATVPLLDDGFQRGDAIFEAVLVSSGHTQGLDDHLARMRESAKAMGLRVPSLSRVVTDLLAAWGDDDGAIKLIVTRDGTVRGIAMETAWPASMSLTVLDMPWRTALSGVKTLSYAINQWAVREAKNRHADDALIVSEGLVQELPTAAIAWVTNDKVYSPDYRNQPILRSVTLTTLADLVAIELGEYPLDAVLEADEVFVLSATRKVMPVHAVDDATYETPGPMTADLQKVFDEHVARHLDPGP